MENQKSEEPRDGLPDGWETMGSGGVRQIYGGRVTRAVWIESGELRNVCPNGETSNRGVPVAVMRHLMDVADRGPHSFIECPKCMHWRPLEIKTCASPVCLGLVRPSRARELLERVVEKASPEWENYESERHLLEDIREFLS